MNKWLKRGGYGALWLLAATMITKLIGVLQKIPLQNVGGDTVFGLYNMIYPLYQLMLVLTITGIPTAISAIIAESSSKQRSVILKASHILMIAIGLVLGIVVYSMSNQLALRLGSADLSDMINIIAVTIMITPLLASYRGYYQGVKLASYASVSQLIEQIIRVTLMVLVLYIGVNQQWTAIELTTYVMWGGVAGAFISLIYLAGVKRPDSVANTIKEEKSTYIYYMRELCIRGLPAALAAVIVPLIAVVDTFTIPTLLKHSTSFMQIAEQFGLYSRIQPLVQLVVMLLAAVIAGVLPDIVLAKTKMFSSETMNTKTTLILRYTTIIGLAATAGLFVLAEPVSIMLYKDLLGVEWFKLLSLMTLPASVLAVVTPLLLVQRKISVLLIMVFTALITKMIFNYYFVSRVESMEGAIYATLIALYLAMLISLVSIRNYKSAIRQPKRDSVVSGSIGALLVMVLYLVSMRFIFEQLFNLNLYNRLAMVLYVIFLVMSGAGILVIVLNKLKVITTQYIKDIVSK